MRIKISPSITLLFLVTWLLPEFAAAGVITMKNGDRITGAVKRIWDGEVYIEPDYADEFAVDQSEVAAIEDDRPFEIEYTDGTSVTAGLLGMDAEGNQLISIGGNVVAVSLLQLEELDEPDEFFDWSINLDANTSIDKGNTDSEEIKINGDLFFKYNRQRHFIDLLLEREEQESIVTKDRNLYQYNFNYEFQGDWFLGAVGSYETDPVRGLDNRYSIVPGLGYEFWNDADRLFIMQAGFGYQNEDTTTTRESGTVAAVFTRFRYDFGKPDLSVFLNNTTSKANFGRENFVTQFSTGIRFEITDLFYFNTQLNYDYESDPEEEAENEDLSLVFGLGLEFDK